MVSKIEERGFNGKKYISKSLLIGALISIIFTISILFTDDIGSSWFVGIVFITPLVFIFIFILSFIFFVSKYFKKLIYFFSFFFLFVGILGFSGVGDYFFKNLLIKTKVPDEFQKYHNLEDNTLMTAGLKSFIFGDHQFKMFLKSERTTEQFITKKGLMIITTFEVPKINTYSVSVEDKIYHKIDKDGNVISKLVEKGDSNGMESIFKEYFVNIRKDYYKSWIIDGDTIRKPFIEQNENLKWNQETIDKKIEKIKNRAQAYIKLESYKAGTTVFYLLDDKWYKLYTNAEKIALLNYDFGKNVSGQTVFNDDYILNLHPQYIQRKAYSTFANPVGAMQPGSVTENTLDLDIYCDLLIGKDILKFILPKTIFENDQESKLFWNIKGEDIRSHEKVFQKMNINYRFFLNKNFNFQLFNNDGFELYMIKTIPKNS